MKRKSIFLIVVVLISVIVWGIVFLQPKNQSANGQPSTLKTQTFTLGEQIYRYYDNYYFFHGSYSNLDYLVIGHKSGGYHLSGMSNIIIQISNQLQFRINDRTFTIVEATIDSVTLSWSE